MLSFLIATALPELPPAQKPVQSKQQIILEQIMQQEETSAERSFGECNYAWNQWKLNAEGVRTTSRTCKGETPVNVAVSCPLLKVNTTNPAQPTKWEGWRSPIAKSAKPGEAMMVASLCANVAE